MQKYARHLVSAIIAGSFVFGGQASGPAYAVDPATMFTAEATVNSIVDNMRNSLEQLLGRLDQTISSGTFLARMQISRLLAELDHHGSGLIDKTFGQLDTQQRAFFRNTQQTISDLDALGANLAENVDTVVQRTEFAIKSIPFTSAEPRLRSIKPRVIEASKAEQPVAITFDGSWLANNDPTLTFDTGECKLTSLSEPKAVFECPPTTFKRDQSSAHQIITGKFSAVREQNLWDKVLSLFGSGPNTKSYPVSIGIVPDSFAYVKVGATALVNTIETNNRSQRYDTGARHCTWGSETTINNTPAGPEWSIDVNSINLVLESGERSELRNVTPQGFQVYAVGHNSGNCVKALGQIVSKDARGWANGHVSWTERRTVQKPNTSLLFEGDLQWGNTKVVPLPTDLQSYIVSLQFFNGKSREYNAPTKDDFFVLERDDTNHSLKLSPRSIYESFK